MNKFELTEKLKDLINTKYEVVEHDIDDGSLTIKVGKKRFVIDIREV